MVRISSTAVIGVLFFFISLLSIAAPAASQENAQEPPPAQSPPPTIANLTIVTPPASRPAVLLPLYVGQAALQAYDGYTTIRGVRNGAQETNPLVGGLAKQPVAFWSIKIASTAVTIYYAERLWRQHHPTEAILLMVVADGAMAAIAARNASVRASSR